MTRKVIIALALVVLAICLISGGCQAPPESNGKVMSWKDMIKMAPKLDTGKLSLKDRTSQTRAKKSVENENAGLEEREIKLYFADSKGQGLAVETRKIEKTEGIARRTMQELIKGPQTSGYSAVFPPGSELRDINLKPDGLCILDFNDEVKNLSDVRTEKMMVDSIAATLSQFPSVKEITFMIDGEKVDCLTGGLDLSKPVMAKPITHF